jgi:hypothetical protein
VGLARVTAITCFAGVFDVVLVIQPVHAVEAIPGPVKPAVDLGIGEYMVPLGRRSLPTALTHPDYPGALVHGLRGDFLPGLPFMPRHHHIPESPCQAAALFLDERILFLDIDTRQLIPAYGERF